MKRNGSWRNGKYRIKDNLFRKTFIWKFVQYTSPITWWKAMCSSTELLKVAAVIWVCLQLLLQLSQSHLHSAERNRLTTARAAKLVYAAHHLTMREDKHQEIQRFTRSSRELYEVDVLFDNCHEEIDNVFRSQRLG